MTATAGFNLGTFEAAIEKLTECRSNMGVLIDKVPYVITAIRANILLTPYHDYLVQLVGFIEDCVRNVQDFLADLWEGYWMPVTFWQKSGEWKDLVAAPVSDAQAFITPAALPIYTNGNWTGTAADKYTRTTALQPKAAEQLAKKANGLGDMMNLAAGAGLAAYVGIGVAVAGFFAEEIVAFLADLTGWGALAGIPAGAMSAGKVITLLAGIALAITAFVTSLNTQLSTLRTLDQADGVFAGMNWPTGAPV